MSNEFFKLTDFVDVVVSAHQGVHRGTVRAADADTEPTAAVGLHLKFDVARIFLESPSKDEITLSVQYLFDETS